MQKKRTNSSDTGSFAKPGLGFRIDGQLHLLWHRIVGTRKELRRLGVEHFSGSRNDGLVDGQQTSETDYALSFEGDGRLHT